MTEPKTRRGPDVVTIIVEETVQRVYEMSPEDPETGMVLNTLRAILLTDASENPFHQPKPPATLGKRAKKGREMPSFMRPKTPVAEWSRYTGLTYVLPNEDGVPAQEVKATMTTISSKPLKTPR